MQIRKYFISILLKYKITRVTGVICFICYLFFAFTCTAQIDKIKRHEIDAKRSGENLSDKDVLPRSREFIRLDSTYYVGWMYDGIYKFERSSDYLGYKQAIFPLNKALLLLEKDYRKNVKNIFSSFIYFNENEKYFNDFYAIVNALEQCYNSIEMPDSTMALFYKIDSYKFQRDFFYTGSGKAWLFHRNRFYNSSKYPFLKNSIEENEAVAIDECFKQIGRIKKNKDLNDKWYGTYHSNEDLLLTYHYLAILHDYKQDYDSSMYYYQLLIAGDRVSWSNYANMLHVNGDFANAIENYSKNEEKRKFSLIEADYYMPMILVYGGKTKDAIAQTQNKINECGSTPGFGWYNIALARSYLYDAQLDSCEFFLDKAANFKELHINTTLTQSQYDFTINLLRIQVIDKQEALVKFFNNGWWYSISDIIKIYSCKLQKVLLEYALVNAMVNNPERDKLVYDLFCSEATASYDESFYLLKDFCLSYFKDKYANYALNDDRKKLNRYFKLFVTKFSFENGDMKIANDLGEKLLQETIYASDKTTDTDKVIDENYERLYAYRLFEVLAQTTESSDKEIFYKNKCFEAYPQLSLFSGLVTEMNVTFTGLENDDVIKTVVEDIKDCNIEFTNKSNVPTATLEFIKKGKTYQVMINVTDSNGYLIVSNGIFLFTEKDGVGKELAMRLFGKGGAIKFEKS